MGNAPSIFFEYVRLTRAIILSRSSLLLSKAGEQVEGFGAGGSAV